MYPFGNNIICTYILLVSTTTMLISQSFFLPCHLFKSNFIGTQKRTKTWMEIEKSVLSFFFLGKPVSQIPSNLQLMYMHTSQFMETDKDELIFIEIQQGKNFNSNTKVERIKTLKTKVIKDPKKPSIHCFLLVYFNMVILRIWNSLFLSLFIHM